MVSIRITVAFQMAGSRSTFRSGAQAWTASASRSRLSGTANNFSMFVSEGACGVTIPELSLKLEHNRNSSIICPLAAHRHSHCVEHSIAPPSRIHSSSILLRCASESLRYASDGVASDNCGWGRCVQVSKLNMHPWRLSLLQVCKFEEAE